MVINKTRGRVVVDSDSEGDEGMQLDQKVNQDQVRPSESPLTTPPASVSPEVPPLSALPATSVSYDELPTLSALASGSFHRESARASIMTSTETRENENSKSPVDSPMASPPKSSPPPSDMSNGRERVAEFEAETAERRAESRGSQEIGADISGQEKTNEAEGPSGSDESSDVGPTDSSTPPSSQGDVQDVGGEKAKVGDTMDGMQQTAGMPEQRVKIAHNEDVAATDAMSGVEKTTSVSQQQAETVEGVRSKEQPIDQAADAEAKATNSNEHPSQVSALVTVNGNATAPELGNNDEEPKEPTAELILDAVQKVERKSFGKGDVAVIMDADDLSKTLLLSSKQLFRASAVLEEMTQDRSSDDGFVKYVLLLEGDQEVTRMPLLRVIDPAQILDEFKISKWKPYTRMLATAKRDAAAKAKKMVKIKKELGNHEDGEENDEEAENVESVAPSLPSTDWVKAYERFFSSVISIPPGAIFDKDASNALPQIEGVIAIATYYEAIPTLDITFKTRLLEWVKNRTLYRAIAADPLSWLSIGLAMKSDNVFEELFPHLVGCYPERLQFEQLEDQTQQKIGKRVEKKGSRLRCLRYEVDQQLLTLRPNEKGALSSPEYRMVARKTLHLWHEFVSDHLGPLRKTTTGDGVLAGAKHSAICNRKDKECLTVAGFYRLLSKGGENYLPLDEVLAEESWDEHVRSFVKMQLAEIKKKATDIVAPLIKSTLQYEDKDDLDYLTCAQIEEKDLPWDKEDD